MAPRSLSGLTSLLVCCLLMATALVCLAGSQLKGHFYLNNYITAIEDSFTDPVGLMVTTADSNYAIFSPRFEQAGWLSVTVNEEQVFIVTSSKSTIVKQLLDLDADERDLIAEVRANFTENLAGLKLSRTVASDSLFLLSNKLAYANAANGANAHPNRNGNVRLSYAEEAIRLIESVNQFSDGGQQAAGGERGGPEKADSEEEEERPSSEANGARSSKKRSRSRKIRSGAEKVAQNARAFTLGYARRPQQKQQSSDASYKSSGLGFCSRKSGAEFSYYNLLNTSLSRQTLSGDVYNFDLRCNILEVYSSTVSIRQAVGLSVLYRDENYYAYSRSDLPHHINRFFLLGNKVFFVYHDRSLLLKHDWLLDPLELEVVVGTRRQLRATSAWRKEDTDQAETKPSDAAAADDDDDSKRAIELVTGSGQDGANGQRARAKDKQ